MSRLYRTTRRAPDVERCELCAVALPARHDHLFDARAHRIRCTCVPCVVIVSSTEASGFRRVPRRFDRLEIDPTVWLARFGIPVGVAAVLRHDDGRAVVAFPGPAGLVEADVDEPLWTALREVAPEPLPEIEALVWSSLDGGGAWLTGIDVVYEMIAAVRENWRGMTGGPEAPRAIARVLAEHGVLA